MSELIVINAANDDLTVILLVNLKQAAGLGEPKPVS